MIDWGRPASRQIVAVPQGNEAVLVVVEALTVAAYVFERRLVVIGCLEDRIYC